MSFDVRKKVQVVQIGTKSKRTAVFPCETVPYIANLPSAVAVVTDRLRLENTVNLPEAFSNGEKSHILEVLVIPVILIYGVALMIVWFDLKRLGVDMEFRNYDVH